NFGLVKNWEAVFEGRVETPFNPSGPTSLTDAGRFGASVAAIISQRWDWGTAHLNIAGALTRDQHADLFTGIILEGPHKWAVQKSSARHIHSRLSLAQYGRGRGNW